MLVWYMINVWAYVKLFFNLGFVVHPEKSFVVLSQEIEYLVFIINSVSMTVRLTSEKKRSLISARKYY